MKIKNIASIGNQWTTLDPFIFAAHHKEVYPSGNEDMSVNASLEGRNIGNDFSSKDGWSMYHGTKIPGFPYHPHRGFETISIMEEGMVDHSDSLGSAGRFGDGDVQWMTAGSGVQHSEMFPMLNTDKENPLEVFQIWLNLPKKDKMATPSYKMLWREDIPVVDEKDQHGRNINVKVIAGPYKGITPLAPTPNSWANNPENNVGIWRVRLEAGAEWTIPKTEKDSNRVIYFYRGSDIQVEGENYAEKLLFRVDPEEDIQIKGGQEDTFILILQGKPIQEPVAKYGPFVMNSSRELQEAFADYQKTEFGGWPWEQSENVHDRSLGRFAKHADGTLEEK